MTREIDEQVAKEIFGWLTSENAPKMWLTRGMTHYAPCVRKCDFNWSTDIKDAWLVVERMRELGMGFMLDNLSGHWEAEFNNVIATADTAPLAICQAALSALRAKEGET